MSLALGTAGLVLGLAASILGVAAAVSGLRGRTDRLLVLRPIAIVGLLGAMASFAAMEIALLTNARSVTARLFTRAESAQNHCQAGNYGLALDTIVGWLDSITPTPWARNRLETP